VLRVRRHGDWRTWCEDGRPLVAHSMMYPAEKPYHGREKECAEVQEPRSSLVFTATFPSYVAFSPQR